VNRYAHREGLFTYKQDYAECFLALRTYHLESRVSYFADSAFDQEDPYDRRWMTAVLRKDLHGRYGRPADAARGRAAAGPSADCNPMTDIKIPYARQSITDDDVRAVLAVLRSD
jgi:hypothetical protein